MSLILNSLHSQQLYEVSANPGSATCLTTGALACAVTGLTNGVGYIFTVTASNQVGVSTASEPSARVTPEPETRIPGRIRDPEATTRGKITLITWEPPVNAALLAHSLSCLRILHPQTRIKEIRNL